MKKKITLLFCLLASMSLSAQEVDKKTVQTQAEAAAAAKDDLKKVDTDFS